ncbi:hypothetical protein AB0N62_38650 [Streptomyces sp. NPDC093982]|uniref:hypothetical protein n=1 Tax=Streptomyces sp. NPDC093982 TaxID=3155077 RepID=UPI00342C4F6F
MDENTTPGAGRTRRLRRTVLPTAIAALTLAAGLAGVQLYHGSEGSGTGTAPVANGERTPGGWQQTSVPFEKGDITAVAALGDKQAWAVGYNLKSYDEVEHVALRWDGTAWKQESTMPDGVFPTTLTVTAVDDIWAAGSTLVHWDGKAWTEERAAKDPAGWVIPEALASAPDGSVWSAGRAMGMGVKTGVPSIQSWDGKRWVRHELPATGNGELNGIVALSKDDVWAVGASYASDAESDQEPLALHFDGTTWTEARLPGTSSHATWLSGLAAPSAKDLWAVGGSFTKTGDQPYALHYDGKAWKRTATPDVPDGRLRAVGQAANGSVWAVGGKGSASVGLRWDEAEHHWEKLAAPGISSRGLGAVPGSSALWAVGIATKGDLVPQIVRFSG